MAEIKELRDEELNNVNGGSTIKPVEAYDEETMSIEKMNYSKISSSNFKTSTFKQAKYGDARLSQSRTLSSRLADNGYFPHFIVVCLEAAERIFK